MEEIEKYLQENSYPYHVFEGNLYQKIAELLAGEKVIGLFHGRMEFGPRALGSAQPRLPPASPAAG